MNWLDTLSKGISQSFSWLICMAFFFLVGALAYISKKIIYSKLLKKSEKRSFCWYSALLKASSGPISCGIWLYVTHLYMNILGLYFEGISSLAYPIFIGIRLIGIILLVWVFYRFAHIYEGSLLRVFGDKKDDVGHIDIISKALKVIFFIIIGSIVLQFISLPLTGLVAFGSVGGVVLGFAGKDILANFFGGLMIYFDRPFKIGDLINSPDREIEGTVEHIGLRLTCIRTLDKCLLYLPNSAFSSIALINVSRMSNRRIKKDITIRYCDAKKVATIVSEIRTMLSEHPEIDQQQGKMVHLLNFGPSSLTLQVYTFTKTTNGKIFRDIQQDVFLKIIDIIQSHGANIAFPTQTVHMKSTPPEPK